MIIIIVMNAFLSRHHFTVVAVIGGARFVSFLYIHKFRWEFCVCASEKTPDVFNRQSFLSEMNGSKCTVA